MTRTNRGAEGISGRVIFADFFQQDARKDLSAKIATPRNGKAAISAEMAIRLEAWTSGPTAETWVRMQAEYDLWQARQKPRPNVTPAPRPEAA
ncbi:helix-turn-helix transcriptional regulator [Methylomonas sp. MK1]|uniref:helix-turn-helix transcriptional regulator n=1 Tax=Methylomonas sp. MK1 TaxID=1131552 RepID=UPI0003A765FE|nr:hypothetical protein [Methylomonas sp. MK1]